MRFALVAAACAISAVTALAQPLPERPDRAAPTATAPAAERQAWCQDYAAWFVSHTPAVEQAPDARPTQRYEVELNSCLPDPQRYERQTLAEIAQVRQTT